MVNNKILTLDIEWRPVKAFVWRAWDENIQPAQIVEDGGLLCVGMKWLGDKEPFLYSEWEHGHADMIRLTHAAMSEADAIVSYNGDKYDLPKLNGEFVLHGLPPVPPVASIDVIKAVKRLGLFMNRLAFVGPFLGLEKKMEHEGFMLWRKVMDGDMKAQKKMERYCKQDVKLTEKLYLKIRPYVKNHPHVGDEARECGACGSNRVHSRGNRRTKYFKVQRLQCVDCGSWQDGKRTKV